MKILILLLVISFSSFSQINPNNCEENVLEKIANGLSLPNCVNTKIGRNPLTRDQAICKTCKDKFESLYPEKLVNLEKERLKKEFLKVSLQEYRKSVINNVLSAIKIRSLPSTGSDFIQSIQSCSLKNIQSFKNGCKNPENLSLLEKDPLFKNLKQEIANEVASFVNDKEGFSQKPTLLDRTANKCFVSERQLVYLNSSVTEEEFSREMIEFFQRIDPKLFSETDSIFDNETFKSLYKGNKDELISGIRSHPILSKHFENPETIQAFFSRVKAPLTKNSLRAQIYSKAEGDLLDGRLAKNCSESFTAIKSLVCGDEFNEGNLSLDPVTNYRKLFNENFTSIPKEYATDETLVNKNLTLFQYCGYYTEKSLSLKDEAKEISAGVEEKFKDNTLPEYISIKYSQEISNPAQNVCSDQCEPNSLSCKIKTKFDKLKDTTSEEYKLANSSNLAGNSLLRSMIGDKNDLNPKTVEVLVSAGILPQADGTLVPQPDIPERRADYFSNEVKRESTVAARTPVPQSQTASQAARSTYTAPTTAQQSPLADDSGNQILRDRNDDSRESISDIEDEIRRRLTEIPRGLPQNRNQARSIVRKAARDKGQTITPAQENQIIDQMMDSTYSPKIPGIERNIASTATPSVSDTPTLAEKWKNAQKDEALAGMAGANQVSKSDIIDQANKDAPRPLTTVALNIAEDPRITLSDIFSDKISRNDAETQLIKVLLRNRKDFVLKLNDMNFKVIFNQNNSFNVLLDKGTGEVALRYKPQLEIFLKRLKV